MTRMLSHKGTIFLFILPGLLLIACFILIPLVYSTIYSLTDWDMVQNYRFIGIENYKQLLQDGVFYHSLWNALLMIVALVFIQHPLAIIAALAAQYLGKSEKLFRGFIFLPTIVGAVVAAKIWTGIFSTQFGMLNQVLDALTLNNLRQDWLGNPDTAIWAIIIASMWSGFGYAFLLYYTGIKGIPADLHEAARMDGASPIKIHLKIDLPLLLPIIKVNATLAVIAGLKSFDIIKLMTNGGPFNVTHMPLTYMYEKAFSFNQYGYGSSVSMTFVAICLAVTLLMNRLIKSEGGGH